MKTAAKIDMKSSLTALHDIANEAGDFISALQTAFIYNTSSPLQEFRSKSKAVEKQIGPLSANIREAVSLEEGIKPYTAVPEHLQSIWKNLDNLYDQIDKKISDKILFSDKAVNETIYLLQRLMEILRPTADMILARNTFMSKYIQESQLNIENMADDYATLHENRLITGECQPVASSIYIGMLGAIRGIAWHTKEIAVVLGT